MQAAALQERLAVVVNPRAAVSAGNGWRELRSPLLAWGESCVEVETRGDGANAARVARTIAETSPDLLVAAGGDGTLADVVQAIMDCPPPIRPKLAIVPLGTANNVARSLGLESCRRGGRRAVELALGAIRNGRDRSIDLGQADDRYFIGSYALGMDADILCLRDRISRRFKASPVLRRVVRGYPLYLWSCAANLLRRHGAPMRMVADGREQTGHGYNVLITNTSIYAGEFRFAAGDPSSDGKLDLQVFGGAADYVAAYSAAWARHLRVTAGAQVPAARRLRRVRDVEIGFDRPVWAQLDGEEMPATQVVRVRAVPAALRVRVPGR